jgi:hypothetical protein
MSATMKDLVEGGFDPSTLQSYVEGGMQPVTVSDTPERDKEVAEVLKERIKAEVTGDTPEQVETQSEYEETAEPEAEAEVQAGPAEQAEAIAEPEERPAPSINWDEVITPETNVTGNRFFEGKPLKEVAKSVQSLYEERSRMARELDEARQKLAAAEAVENYVEKVKRAAETSKPPEDPWKARGIDLDDPLTPPAQIAQAAQEIAEERATKLVEQRFAEQEQARSAERQAVEREQKIFQSIGIARQHLLNQGVVDEATFDALIPHAVNDIFINGGNKDERLMVNPENYVTAVSSFRQRFGGPQPSPAQAQRQASKPKPAAPPGSKKPAAASERPSSTGPRVSGPVSNTIDSITDVLANSGVAGWSDKEKARKYMREGTTARLGAK